MNGYLAAGGFIGFVVLIVVLFYIYRILGQIHVLVNSRLTEALEDITALKKALVDERRHSGKGRR